MATFTGLGDLVTRREEREKKLNGEKPEWFSKILSSRNGKPVKIRFMQELSDQAKLYNAERGTFLGADEHEAPGPVGYQARALDSTEEEGKDWAQEQDDACWGMGWALKTNFYINVAVEHIDPSTGQKEVRTAIMSRPIGSEFVTDLVKRYKETDGLGITDKTYWLSRSGQGGQTRWNLEEITEPTDQIGFEHLDCWDLNAKAVHKVPYAEQAAFYLAKADIPWAARELAERRSKKNKTTTEEELNKIRERLPDYSEFVTDKTQVDGGSQRPSYGSDEGEPGPEPAAASSGGGTGKKKYGW